MKLDELSTGALVDAGNRAFTRSEVAKKKGDKVEAFRRLAQSRKFIKRALENKPEEKPMKENFEQAYVESQARIALVLAESLGLIEAKETHAEYREKTEKALEAHRKAERERLGVTPYPSPKKLKAMARDKDKKTT